MNFCTDSHEKRFCECGLWIFIFLSEIYKFDGKAQKWNPNSVAFPFWMMREMKRNLMQKEMVLRHSVTCHFVSLPFYQLATLLGYSFVKFITVIFINFVNFLFCKLGILSSWHFISLAFCQLAILSTCHFVNLPFINLPVYQLGISSTCHFVNLPFSPLTI